MFRCTQQAVPSEIASRFRRSELDDAAKREIDRVLLEVGEGSQLPAHRSLPGDRAMLRGVPMIGVEGGLGGCITDAFVPGSDAHLEALG